MEEKVVKKTSFMDEDLKLPKKKNIDEKYYKGNGEKCWPEEAYYFIKIPHRIYLNKEVEGKIIDQYKHVISTSNVIKHYIANATNNTEILKDRKSTYFMRLRFDNGSAVNDGITILTSREKAEVIDSYVIQNVLGLVLSEGRYWFLEDRKDLTKDNTVRHHILASAPYLKYIHDKNNYYSFSNDITWAQGNLLLGPNPGLNYHDSGQEGKGHLSQKENNELTRAAGISLPERENSSIEAWIFNKPRTEAADTNLKLIIKCANSYSSFQSSSDQESIDQAFLEFAIAWQDLIKRPMLTGLWSFNVDESTSIVKLQCEMLFTLGKGISLKGSSIITELQKIRTQIKI